MKERPILFSAPMIRALLANTKTQTRRALSPQPPETTHQVSKWHHPDLRPHFFAWTDNGKGGAELADGGWCKPCPYGMPGERLWVREAFRLCAEADATPPRDTDAAYRVWYEADAPHQPGFGKLRPSMFMPRWACRLVLTLESVRVERLNDISESDALAEGVTPKWEPGCSGRLMEALGGFSFRPAASAYADLWEQINGPGSWDANPWVWCLSFRRVAP